MKIVEAKKVDKQFGSITALEGFSTTISQGEIYGLLGPNGAGKSTFINILSGLIGHDRGEVLVFGEKLKSKNTLLKRRMGLVPQNIAVYENLTARENIQFFCSLYGYRGEDLHRRVADALEFVGLQDAKEQRAKGFSGGMKRRLNIACALAHTPELIILDEPTVGIDPQSRNRILTTVKELKRRGSTILYTTHYMEEAETLCSRVGIIDHGKLIAEGTKDELKTMISDSTEIVVRSPSVILEDRVSFKDLPGLERVEIRGDQILFSAKKERLSMDQIVKKVIENNIEIFSIDVKKPNLEQVFLGLTGRTLRDGGERA